MEIWQILVLVFGIILGLYLALVVLDVIFVFSFKKIFNAHDKTLNLILFNKYDNLKRLYALCSSFKELDENTKIKSNELERIETNDFIHQDSEECKNARNKLSEIRDTIYFAINNDEQLSIHKDINQLISNINEADSNYRTLLAMYNADVLGYNYWIHFLPTRFIYKIFKVKKKQLVA